MSKVNRCSGQEGFSLLEILVAFSILALSLGVLLNIFSSGVQTAVLSEEYTAAVQIAESVLAKAGVENELVEGQFYGAEHEKYKWTMTNSVYEVYAQHNLEAESSTKKNQNSRIFQVVVTVSWGDEDQDNDRSVELNTLKYGSNES